MRLLRIMQKPRPKLVEDGGAQKSVGALKAELIQRARSLQKISQTLQQNMLQKPPQREMFKSIPAMRLRKNQAMRHLLKERSKILI